MNTLNQRAFLKSTSLSLAVSPLLFNCQQQNKLPNIVFLMLDELGFY
jgi:hypothetical protein